MMTDGARLHTYYQRGRFEKTFEVEYRFTPYQEEHLHVAPLPLDATPREMAEWGERMKMREKIIANVSDMIARALLEAK